MKIEDIQKAATLEQQLYECDEKIAEFKKLDPLMELNKSKTNGGWTWLSHSPRLKKLYKKRRKQMIKELKVLRREIIAKIEEI